MPTVLDDKSEHCIPFILDCIDDHRKTHAANDQSRPPFFLGLNGVQGSGKTTLVRSQHSGTHVVVTKHLSLLNMHGAPLSDFMLRQVSTLSGTLSSPPYNFSTAILSIDDIYLPHAAQQVLASSNPLNPLIQHRGQPSTHDVALGQAVLTSLFHRQPTRIPSYDKSAFDGQGDRTDLESWKLVNGVESAEKVEVVVFEGWCVGFRALSDSDLVDKWETKRKEVEVGDTESRLGRNRLEDVKYINDQLRRYDILTDMFDALIHLDAEDTQYVYRWRVEQEVALRASKGAGMTDEQVIRFVDGYYPAYELYTDGLRAGVVKGNMHGRQLRLIIDADRRVQEVIRI